MRIVRHPFVEWDLIGIADHIVKTTKGDDVAASAGLDEIDVLIRSVPKNSTFDIRLRLDGWLVRHGGPG